MGFVRIVETRVRGHVVKVVDLGYHIPPSPESFTHHHGHEAIIKLNDGRDVFMPACGAEEGDLVEVIYVRYRFFEIEWLTFGGATGFEKVAA
jgi:hypothetical protein